LRTSFERMSYSAIQVEGLCKQYQIGAVQEEYGTLRDAIMRAVTAPFRRQTRTQQADTTLKALQSVSFDVPAGEVLGIIGRNGAGKSTLLKVLSRITEPTAGRIKIRGRVASLLEVGTGFHAELSGRENLYLNGSILGMSRREIQRKFDEIVQFAEVERFIDTPVKRYSSGMYLRLAFAVAAHLDPEILIVDEVLAVGDSAFQNKCIGRMEAAAKEGRTVLFVSHNMAAIRGLCQRCIWLSHGSLVRDGRPGEVVDAYLAVGDEASGSVDLINHPGRKTQGEQAFLQRLRFLDSAGQITSSFPVGSAFRVALDVKLEDLSRRPTALLWVTNGAGDRMFTIDSGFQAQPLPGIDRTGTIYCTLPEIPLRPGRYTVHLGFGVHSRSTEVIEEAASFHVTPDDFFGVGKLTPERYGAFLVRGSWTTN